MAGRREGAASRLTDSWPAGHPAVNDKREVRMPEERAPSRPDIALYEAMLCWTRGEAVAVVPHPDYRGLSDPYLSSAGACWATWREKDDRDRKLQLMIDAWHISAFYDIPAQEVHRALLVIPEYRDMLADDCLPKQYRYERD